MFKSWKGGKEEGGEGALPYQAAAAKPISPARVSLPQLLQ